METRTHKHRALRVVCGTVAGTFAIAVGICVSALVWNDNVPVEITVNDATYTVSGDERTINGLLDHGRVNAKAGNYLAVDGSVLREGEGSRCSATLNNKAVDNLDMRLNEGDVLQIADGTDLTEPYEESEPEVLPATTECQGVGAVHLYLTHKQDGEKVSRTGLETNKTVDVITKEPINGLVQYYNVNSNGDKVVALTFDDGPWDTYTQEILDILAQFNAKATFFSVGARAEENPQLIQAESAAGHQVCTHTYDHAAGSGKGVSLIKMFTEERKTEITRGMEAIKSATGQEVSSVIRVPGGNFDRAVATDLDSLTTAEIGWNVDTGDWGKPGAAKIARRIEMAGPGDIVLMHDGGGDRSQTVEGLRFAIAKLAEQGYRFVTIDELINSYPYQE